MIACASLTLPTLSAVQLTLLNPVETFLQSGGQKPSRWKPSSNLEDENHHDGNLPPIWRTKIITMETFLQFGGRFRSQRIVPPNWRVFPQPADCSSKLEGVSAASGLLLQSGAINNSLFKVSCTFAGTSAACGNALHFCSGIPLAEDDSRTFAVQYHFPAVQYDFVQTIYDF